MPGKRKEVDVDWVVEQYRLGKSSQYIADCLGCTSLTVRRRLRERGEVIRRKDGNYGEPFTVNEDFFKRWNDDVAYILGYIAADGCIRTSQYELKLKSIDYDLLQYIKETLNTNYEIKREKNSNCHVLRIMSKKIIDDLLQHGIADRKSLVIEFPDIPDDFFWSYMRGLTDGDGHVRLCNATSREISVQISGNEKYLTKMLRILNSKIGCPMYALNPQGKSAAVGIYGKYGYICLSKMYDNEFWALPRKRKAALAAIQNYDRNRLLVCECGEVIKHAHHNKKYCDICSSRRNKECRMRYAMRSNRTL